MSTVYSSHSFHSYKKIDEYFHRTKPMRGSKGRVVPLTARRKNDGRAEYIGGDYHCYLSRMAIKKSIVIYKADGRILICPRGLPSSDCFTLIDNLLNPYWMVTCYDRHRLVLVDERTGKCYPLADTVTIGADGQIQNPKPFTRHILKRKEMNKIRAKHIDLFELIRVTGELTNSPNPIPKELKEDFIKFKANPFDYLGSDDAEKRAMGISFCVNQCYRHSYCGHEWLDLRFDAKFFKQYFEYILKHRYKDILFEVVTSEVGRYLGDPNIEFFADDMSNDWE